MSVNNLMLSTQENGDHVYYKEKDYRDKDKRVKKMIRWDSGLFSVRVYTDSMFILKRYKKG